MEQKIKAGVSASEFRLGNIVAVEGVEGWHVVEGIKHDYVQVQGNWIANRIEHIEPVKLSEEILIRAGFEKVYESEFRKKFDYIKPMYGYDLSYSEGLITGFRYCGDYFGDITYLHQLQNIIYAMSGSELQIKQL